MEGSLRRDETTGVLIKIAQYNCRGRNNDFITLLNFHIVKILIFL